MYVYTVNIYCTYVWCHTHCSSERFVWVDDLVDEDTDYVAVTVVLRIRRTSQQLQGEEEGEEEEEEEKHCKQFSHSLNRRVRSMYMYIVKFNNRHLYN